MEDDIAFLDKIANEPWRICDEAMILVLTEAGIKADQPVVARYMRLRAVGVSKEVEEALGNKHTWVQVYMGLFRRPTVPVLFWSHERAFLVVATNLANLHDITLADVADATATLRGYCAKRGCFIGHLSLSVGLPGSSSDDDEVLLSDISLRDEDDDVIMREPELPSHAASVAFVSHAKVSVEYFPPSYTTSFGAASAQSVSYIAPLQPSTAHNLPSQVEQPAFATFPKPHNPISSWNNTPSTMAGNARILSFASTPSAFRLPSTATSSTLGATSPATNSLIGSFSTATDSNASSGTSTANITFSSFSTTRGSTISRPSTLSGTQTTFFNESSFMTRQQSFAAASHAPANATAKWHTPSATGGPSATADSALHLTAAPTNAPVGAKLGSPRGFSAHRRPASVYIPTHDGRLRENTRFEFRRRVEQRMEQRRVLGRGAPRPTSMYELGTGAGHVASLSAAQCPQVDLFRTPSSMIPSFSLNDDLNDHDMDTSSNDNRRRTGPASTPFWTPSQDPAPTPRIPDSRTTHPAIDYNNSTARHIRFLD